VFNPRHTPTPLEKALLEVYEHVEEHGVPPEPKNTTEIIYRALHKRKFDWAINDALSKRNKRFKDNFDLKPRIWQQKALDLVSVQHERQVK
jgi:hypothetical protein